MKEVEVKARVTNLSKLEKAIAELGCELSEPIRQEDRIYLLGNGNNRNQHKNVLRIRVQDDRSLFTLKRDVTGEMDSIEAELGIDDPQAMAEILDYLGYKEVVKVIKKRRTCRHNDYQVCIDTVEGLGTFIEVEKMTDEDGPKVQAELMAFLESIGVSVKDRVTQGYDTLMQQKNSSGA